MKHIDFSCCNTQILTNSILILLRHYVAISRINKKMMKRFTGVSKLISIHQTVGAATSLKIVKASLKNAVLYRHIYLKYRHIKCAGKHCAKHYKSNGYSLL